MYVVMSVQGHCIFLFMPGAFISRTCYTMAIYLVHIYIYVCVCLCVYVNYQELQTYDVIQRTLFLNIGYFDSLFYQAPRGANLSQGSVEWIS